MVNDDENQTEAKPLWFGLKPPPEAKVAWGARAIFQQDHSGDVYLDFVWDRQSWLGNTIDCDDLKKWIDANLITNLVYIVDEENLAPSENRLVRRAIKTAQGEEVCSKPPRQLPYGGSRKKRVPVLVRDIAVSNGMSSSWGVVWVDLNPNRSHGYLYICIWRS